MGFSGGKSEQESQSGGQFGQDVWGGQSPFLQNMYGSLQGLFGNMMGGMQPRVEEGADYQQGIAEGSMPAWQQQMQGGAYAGMDPNQVMQSITQGMGPQRTATQDINEMIMGGEGNDYVDAMKGQMQSDSYENLMKTMSGLDSRAAASGMGGGSRHGIAQGQAIQGSQDALARAQTELGVGSFDRDLQRKLDIAGQADQSNLARWQTGQQSLQDMLGGKQQAMQGGMGFGQNMQQMGMGQFSPYNQPWNMAGNWANMLGRPQVLGSGSTSGSGSGESKSMGMGK